MAENKEFYLVIKGEKIIDVGPMEFCPADPESYDLSGYTIYPGFIDAHCHIGLWADGAGIEGDDGNEDTDPATPHLRAIDAINPRDNCFGEAVEAGVTSVVTGPGSANPVAGQMLAMKTFGDCVDEMIIKSPIAMKFALGENPKNTYHGRDQSPATRMATAFWIRGCFESLRAERLPWMTPRKMVSSAIAASSTEKPMRIEEDVRRDDNSMTVSPGIGQKAETTAARTASNTPVYSANFNGCLWTPLHNLS